MTGIYAGNGTIFGFPASTESVASIKGFPSGIKTWIPYNAGWSSTDKSADATVSGGNNNLCTSNGVGDGSARTSLKLPLRTFAHFILRVNGIGIIGIANSSEDLTTYPGGSVNSIGFDGEDGKVYYNGTSLFSGTIGVTDTIISIFRDGNYVWFARNGVYFRGDPFTGTLPFVHNIQGDLYFMGPRSVSSAVSIMPSINFPTGFVPSLSTV